MGGGGLLICRLEAGVVHKCPVFSLGLTGCVDILCQLEIWTLDNVVFISLGQSSHLTSWFCGVEFSPN